MDIQKSIKNKALWKFADSEFHVQTSESGLHSDLYLNTDLIVSDTLLVEAVVKTVFVKELQSKKITPDWIITYPPFGLAIAYALARATGAKFGYVDLEAATCNFDIKKDEVVIIVGDDIYSGGSLKKTINIVNHLNAKIVAPIFTIGNFSGIKELLNLEVCSVITEKGNLYAKAECPMCKAGSKAVLPRPNWNFLMKK
jgi:orotate phosphoribosyltransferase